MQVHKGKLRCDPGPAARQQPIPVLDRGASDDEVAEAGTWGGGPFQKQQRRRRAGAAPRLAPDRPPRVDMEAVCAAAPAGKLVAVKVGVRWRGG